MKTNYNKEDLFHSLPDYIASHIDDDELLKEIKKEIELNPEFKSEYEDMKNTCNFLDTAELEGPNDNYFNNLSVRINSRIADNSKYSMWESIGSMWKILLPAVCVIIIAVLLYNNLKNDTTETRLTNNTDTKVESNESNPGSDKNNMEPAFSKEKENIQNSELQNFNNNNITKDKVRNTPRRVNGNQVFNNPSELINDSKQFESPLTNNSIAENIEDNTVIESEDDVLYIIDSEDEDYEDEFLSLTPAEQQEILENLSKSQI